ncbi:Mitosis inhibitor protein kinase wee1 [Cladobotryum mycophilum]|uniref:Mitosis inhibitor protein kinase wee1 n=1 Tax=Cladobotryum mycophilum TaxID=491253 RepID=A0ABR0SJI5_9HYPO
MSFSNGGGTLALPSPTHVHHMDVTAAVRSLRRSMSRSPTKLLTRTTSQTSDNSRQGSPQSPCRRIGTTPLQQRHLLSTTPQTAPPALHSSSTLGGAPHQSAALTPLRPSVKLSLRSAKAAKTSTPSRITRARASPKSPLKRALSATPDSGNSAGAHSSTLSSPGTRLMGQENTISLRSTPRKGIEKSRHTSQLDTGATQAAFLKAFDSIIDSPMVSTTGALKRSDATMNLDQPNQGSPVAKRRSLHSVANAAQPEDMNIFGTNTSSSQPFDIHEDLFPEYELSGAMGSGFQRDLPSPTPTSIPKRSSSLRKSTLQQRYGDKNSWGRRTGERQLAQMSGDFSTPVRNRPRLSTDHFVPPQAPSRDSPFTSGSPLPNASLHAAESKTHQPHPLSKTLTTSSSGNHLTEEPSGYAPATVIDRQTAHPFSKSLPVGATRPTAPHHYEHAKPMATPMHPTPVWRAAFTSTGLISKVNRNPEEEADKKIAPPDTPCKKHSNPFATFPPPAGSAIKKRLHGRNSIAGLPSTPFNPISTHAPDTFGNPGKGLSIFQRNASQSARRASILSLDGDDRRFFTETVEFSNPLDDDAPPTPTKNSLTPSFSSLFEQPLESPSTNRQFGLPLSAVKPAISREASCKSTPKSAYSPKDQVGEASHHANQHTPLDCGPSSNQPTSSFSFGRTRSKRGFSTPPPLITESPSLMGRHSLLLSKSSKNMFAKITCVDPASPADGRRTPQTPQESLLPLDTSRLSISQVGDSPGDNGMPPPLPPPPDETFDPRQASSLPPLYSRFDKVEQIGKGEFSTVYRVTKLDHKPSFSMSAVTPSHEEGRSPSKGQVFAVKKSKQPYTGHKNREEKLKEARILQALSHAEHVVQYVDEWEHNFHLYIQTEFCEEGTLDKFLGNVGRSGRLDDFRIYKILQDLCLGVKEIHDAGFMHLDLKPANILITFEGALKIGDFGLAEPSCSFTGKMETEGDREYMAPEMLRSEVTKAADVFSLGLMTLETAANVVLPDNGPTWVALRSGDLSEVPSLTWSPSVEVQRDASGTPTELVDGDEPEVSRSPTSGNLFGSFKRQELQQPPDFMVEAFHPSSLDSIVRWMTSENAEDRPLIDQVLALEGLQWVAEHRNAPATVYEGNWGPLELFPVSISTDDDDTEMTDV